MTDTQSGSALFNIQRLDTVSTTGSTLFRADNFLFKMEIDTLIKIQNVKKSYQGGFEALRGVNLEIKRGEISSLDNKISSLLLEIQAVSEQKKKKETALKSLKNNFSTLKDKKEKLQNDLTESDYFVKMKDKEIDSLVSEKGDLIDNLQKKNQEVETLSENLKFNKNSSSLKTFRPLPNQFFSNLVKLHRSESLIII